MTIQINALHTEKEKNTQKNEKSTATEATPQMNGKSCPDSDTSDHGNQKNTNAQAHTNIPHILEHSNRYTF